jgi:hypothetical protein
VTNDPGVWEEARADWLNRHPDVMRRAGEDAPAPTPDPLPDAPACE